MLRSKTTKTSKKGISTGMWSVTGKHGVKKGGYHTVGKTTFGKTTSGIGHGTTQYGKFSSNYPANLQGGNVGLMTKNIPSTTVVNKTMGSEYLPSQQDVSGIWYTSNPQTLTGSENYSSQVSPRTVTTTVTEYLPYSQINGINGYQAGSQELVSNVGIESNDVLSNDVLSTTEYLPVNQIGFGSDYSVINQPVSGNVALLSKTMPSTQMVSKTGAKYLPYNQINTGIPCFTIGQPVSGNVALLTKTMPSGHVFCSPTTAFLPVQYGTFSTGNAIINKKPVIGKVSKNLISKKGISTLGTQSILSYKKTRPVKKTNRYSK